MEKNNNNCIKRNRIINLMNCISLTNDILLDNLCLTLENLKVHIRVIFYGLAFF